MEQCQMKIRKTKIIRDCPGALGGSCVSKMAERRQHVVTFLQQFSFLFVFYVNLRTYVHVVGVPVRTLHSYSFVDFSSFCGTGTTAMLLMRLKDTDSDSKVRFKLLTDEIYNQLVAALLLFT